MSALELHVWPGEWQLPSVDPACLGELDISKLAQTGAADWLKTENRFSEAASRLQLVSPTEWVLVECTDPGLSPDGERPL
jgi:hypothetical protein